MRDLNDFTAQEWLRFLPAQQAFKQLRNDAWLAMYKKSRPKNLDLFLKDTERFKNRNIALVIAFEQPWALEWLLRMAEKNLTDTTLLVFDNSRKDNARLQIEQVCRSHATPYLALPTNPTRHVNRSHGMAMTWIYHNVVRQIQPRLFAFIDHDMIPVQQTDFAGQLGDQPFYGWKIGVNQRFWSLWAGYCLYDFSVVAGLDMNFLYDFSRGLDTGGRNWDCLYRKHDQDALRFAASRHIDVRDPVSAEATTVQIIDETWFHIGGISMNNNFRTKAQFCENLAHALDQGMSWPQICQQS